MNAAIVAVPTQSHAETASKLLARGALVPLPRIPEAADVGQAGTQSAGGPGAAASRSMLDSQGLGGELVALKRASGSPAPGRPAKHTLRLSAPERPGLAALGFLRQTVQRQQRFGRSLARVAPPFTTRAHGLRAVRVHARSRWRQ